jgi:aerobic-type carbon monoxide dehydrogenase small subunit (CoxS/CutS family)
VFAITAISSVGSNPAVAQGKGQGSASVTTQISFREGYQVPVGKRLLIDDVSVACTTVGTTLADFRTFGLSASALLQISYPRADCPEPLDSEGECHQQYTVGTAKQNGIEPLFVTADGGDVTTVEGLAEPDGTLSPVQQAFQDCHGLQCGYCTPGFLTTITAGLRETPNPTRDEAREMIAGNLCRCTGYLNIIAAVLRAAELSDGRP